MAEHLGFISSYQPKYILETYYCLSPLPSLSGALCLKKKDSHKPIISDDCQPFLSDSKDSSSEYRRYRYGVMEEIPSQMRHNVKLQMVLSPSK